jgi:hypothetical protein
MTSRELVNSTLEFTNVNGRVPRELWTLPWANLHHPKGLQDIIDSFEWDFDGAPVELKEYPPTKGDPYVVGQFVDEWGCVFTNVNNGTIGEVKTPLITDEDWTDVGNIHIPDEYLAFDVDAVNRFCAGTDRFVKASCCPRPFERLQFIRGTADLYMDLMDPPPRMIEFIKRMHEHECKLFERWSKTDVDGLMFMDDWGSQRTLLIHPELWKEIFMPMYRDYIDIAKGHHKKTFMHSDGNTISILPSLIELGLDAINTQLFCIGVPNLAPFKGKITFWGEIDRQHLIPYGTLEEIDAAVDSVSDTLWADGGCIAQCEFGALGKPENVKRIYERWSQIR